ncbi:MAG: hypothetical protein RR052_00560 [Oscillospiraceae bacterium]
MISMRPILEPDVIALLNNNRFEGEIQGYTITNGKEYLGNCIFKTEDKLITVLDATAEGTQNNPPDYSILDGVIRAAIANGQNAGATNFKILTTTPSLEKWLNAFCKGKKGEISIDELFTKCEDLT